MRDQVIRLMKLLGIDPDKMVDGLAAYVLEQYKAGVARGLKMIEDAGAENQAMFQGGEPPQISMMEKVIAERKAALREFFVDVYERHFPDAAELDAIIAFYESPLGRTVVNIGRVVQHEIVEVGETWAADAQATVERQIEAELAATPPVAAEGGK
jgi:hypothetical protein